MLPCTQPALAGLSERTPRCSDAGLCSLHLHREPKEHKGPIPVLAVTGKFLVATERSV